jgi:Mg2+/citrate symporter
MGQAFTDRRDRRRGVGVVQVLASAIFNPLLPVQAVGPGFVFLSAWWLGRRETQRVGFKDRGDTARCCCAS